VALSFDAWKPGAVQLATVEVPVQVLDVAASPQLAATLKGHEEPVGQVAWSPDGKTLASLSPGKAEVKLWDMAERKERAALRSDLGDSYGLEFTPDAKTLLVGHYKVAAKAGPTGGISLWDVATGQRTGLLQHTPPRGVVRLTLAADGRTLAASEGWREGAKGEYKHGVTLWDLPSGNAQASLPGNHNTLAFSPDGKVLAQMFHIVKDNRLDGAEVRRHDLTTGKDLPALPNTASKDLVFGLTFSPDGRTLAGADSQGNILLWDTTSAKVRATLKQEGKRRVVGLAFAPDGKTLAAAVGDAPGRDHQPGLIVLWDVACGQRRLTLTGHTNAVLSVAFSPDGKLLASGGSDRTVRLWDMTALRAFAND
jgi:WD40 repeat protein